MTQTTRGEEILTIRVSRYDDHFIIKCDQVRGLFLATTEFNKTVNQILPALHILARAGEQVPGVNS